MRLEMLKENQRVDLFKVVIEDIFSTYIQDENKNIPGTTLALSLDKIFEKEELSQFKSEIEYIIPVIIREFGKIAIQKYVSLLFSNFPDFGDFYNGWERNLR